MNLLGRLTLFFIIVPLVELVLLVRMGQVVGLWPTLALVVGTGLAGAVLARAEGLRVLYRFQAELASGRLPGRSLLDGIAVLVGGAFLLTPGILTDLAGFALLLPPSRRWIQSYVRRGLERGLETGAIRVVTMRPGPFGPGGDAAGSGWTGEAHRGSQTGDLDPSKGIVVEPKEG